MGRRAGPGEMYCPSCGTLIDADVNYCPACGNAIQDRRDSSQPTRPADGHAQTPDRAGDQPRRRNYPDHGSYPPIADRDPREGTDRARRESEYYAEYGSGYPRERDWQRPASPPARHAPGEYATPYEHHRRRQPSSSDSTVRALSVAVGLGILGVILMGMATLFGLSVVAGFPIPSGFALVIAVVAGQFIGFVGLSVAYLRERGFDWDGIKSYVGIRAPTPRELGIVVAGNLAIVAMLAVYFGMLEAFSMHQGGTEVESVRGEAEQFGAIGYLFVVLFMLLVVGPAEEFLYRGVVQNRLREQLSVTPALVIAGAVFTLVHVQIYAFGSGGLGILLGFLILFIPAMVLGVVYEYTENIVVPTLVHGIHNSLIVTLVFYGPESIIEYLVW